MTTAVEIDETELEALRPLMGRMAAFSQKLTGQLKGFSLAQDPIAITPTQFSILWSHFNATAEALNERNNGLEKLPLTMHHILRDHIDKYATGVHYLRVPYDSDRFTDQHILRALNSHYELDLNLRETIDNFQLFYPGHEKLNAILDHFHDEMLPELEGIIQQLEEKSGLTVEEQAQLRETAKQTRLEGKDIITAIAPDEWLQSAAAAPA